MDEKAREISPPVESRRGIWSRHFRGRRPGPLVGPWVSSIALGAFTYYIERTIPALHDIAVPIYVALLVIVIVATVRWARARTADRRDGERRRRDRRNDSGT